MKKKELIALLADKPDESEVFFSFDDSYNSVYKMGIKRVRVNDKNQIILDNEDD